MVYLTSAQKTWTKTSKYKGIELKKIDKGSRRSWRRRNRTRARPVVGFCKKGLMMAFLP